jgi:hypothetical protein
MNYPQQSAQGLASLGRYGDTMLVHMSPKEVEGLQGLAMSQGGSLTINPQTGLPEAFILPMLGGAALSKFMGPMAAGLLIGGATALTSGDIGKGIMAGLGGYGGADLGKIFTKMGTQSVGGMPVGAPAQAVAENVAQNAASNLGMFNSQGATAAMGAAGNAIPGAGLSNFNNLGLSSQTVGPGVNSAVNAMGAAPSSTQIAESTLAPSSSSSLFGDMGKGFGKLIDDPFDKGFEAFKQAGGEGGIPLETGEAAMKLGSPVVGLALSGMKPPVPQPYIDPDTGKYRGPQGQLNLSDRFDTGLRLAQGGAIKSYAIGGNVGNPSVGGGLSDLYNRPEGQTLESISNDGYGIGRLNNLAGAQSKYQAQTLGYADGGDVGMNLNDNALNINLTGKPSDSQSGGMGQPGGMGGLNSQQMGNPFFGMMGLGRGALPEPIAYNLNVNTGKQEPQYAANQGPESMGSSLGVLGGLYGLGYSPLGVGGVMGPGPYGMNSIFKNLRKPEPKSYTLNVNSGQQEAQYADGGYLNGDGDGMSDSIPATIEGKQPARLADGEFVVPADVVSHLGNGSSKAGSKRLYAMLDKVRHARTGNKKQGKEIKADKYLPA